MKIDLGKILARSWQIIWNHKVLWIFGILAGFASGRGGGNAGHNGLRSISAHRSNEYVRVRLGIGHPGHKDLVHNWVLGDFAKADKAWLDELLDAIARSASYLAKGENERFMSDVARLTGETIASPAKEKRAEQRDSAPKPTPAPKPPGGHPAGERIKKQQNALAENLKAWMAAKARKDE